MKPIGPLMVEHRLIERTFAALRKKIEVMSRTTGIDIKFFESVLDFFRVYVDKAHHGKEEEILFKALLTKPLSEEHRGLMDELIADHVSGRKIFADFADIVNTATSGNGDSIERIGELCDSLEILYSEHIEKEDIRFFYPILEYLNQEEQNQMLETMREYDAKVMHEKFDRMVADWEK